MLNQHPDVSLNPVKEIRYFPEAYLHAGEGLVRRFIGDDWHNAEYRKQLRRRIKAYLKSPPLDKASLKAVGWHWKYFFGKRSDAWFASLFSSDSSVLTGDFTPQTYRIPQEHIVRISREWPQTKVMLALRDPVDWMWSIAKLWYFNTRVPSQVSDDEFLKFVKSYPPYPTLEKVLAWQDAFSGRFKLLYFDDFTADRSEFLMRVCEFLGLRLEPIATFTNVPRKRFPGPHLDLTARFHRILIEYYEPQVRRLADHFGRWPEQWLVNYRKEAGEV